MNKQILKVLVFVGLFLSGIVNVFALDANIQVDKNQIDINDYIKLRVEISSTEGGEIGITQIKGIDNFEVLNQSQSQSSSTSVVMVNGQTKQETKTTINLDLILRAHQKGEYTIGPVILQNGNDKIETNSIKVKVTGENLMINNTNNLGTISTTNTNSAKQTTNNIGNKVNNKNVSINTYDDVEKKNFDNNNALYLLLGVIMIMGLGFYFYLKNNPELLERIENKSSNNNQNNKDNEGKDINNSEEEIDFEKVDKIVYPEISDANFIEKITDVFRKKIQLKYKINNIENKTLEEIVELIGEKENFEELISLINKAKYSNVILDNNKIFNLVRDI